uniref:Uncharacterized protein n=1 Tax=Arundo donax TaxID=35708 RepID=A0A0A9CLG1_ARUDO
MFIADLLSHQTLLATSNSDSRFLAHRIPLTTSDIALYSALVFELDTINCFVLLHDNKFPQQRYNIPM